MPISPSNPSVQSVRYIRSNQRKQQQRHQYQQQRLHGAFTGGFSAGYFNTVGTEQGWTPQNDDNSNDDKNDKDQAITPTTAGRKRPRQRQKVEDFMDDQDMNEWGGPTAVRAEYQEGKDNRNSTTTTVSVDSFWQPTVGRHQVSKGYQLLQQNWGWKPDSSYIYIPAKQSSPINDNNNATTTPVKEKGRNDDLDELLAKSNSNDENDKSANIVLAKRSMRRIKLRQDNQTPLPPIKYNTAGLGFDVLANAPEFANLTANTNKSRRVYKFSDFHMKSNTATPTAANMMSKSLPQQRQQRETWRDFVGTHTVGGFAIHEDEDDVYDNDDDNYEVRGRGYQNEIVEYSDEEDIAGITNSKQKETMKSRKEGDKMENLLSSWANQKDVEDHITAPKSTRIILTSNGRPPLDGFVVGTAHAKQQLQRFPGPEIPHNYSEEHRKRQHRIHSSEAIQLLLHSKYVLSQNGGKQQAIKKAGNQRPSLWSRSGGTSSFSGLGNAMKKRFATASQSNEEAPHQIGLYRPKDQVKKTSESTLAKKPTSATNKLSNSSKSLVFVKNIKMKRTVTPFHPDPLLCKRLGVLVPEPRMLVSSRGASVTIETPNISTKKHDGSEAAFFETEVLNKIGDGNKARAVFGDEDEDNEDGQPQEIVRPSIDVYKSIYNESNFLQSSSESEENKEDGANKSEKVDGKETNPNSHHDSGDKNEDHKHRQSTAQDSKPHETFAMDKEQRKEEHRRRRKRRREEEHQHKKKKKKKKKKKRHKSRRSYKSSSDTDLDQDSSDNNGS